MKRMLSQWHQNPKMKLLTLKNTNHKKLMKIKKKKSKNLKKKRKKKRMKKMLK